MIAAWDLSSQRPSFAWSDAQGQIQTADFGESKPTEFLLLCLQQRMQETDQALQALATVIGPGSFTGIRSGIASMLGFQVAKGTRLYGFSKFQLLLAANQGRDGLYLVPGGRRECFHWQRQAGAWLGEPQLSPWEKLPRMEVSYSLEPCECPAQLLTGDYASHCIAAVQAGAKSEDQPLTPLYIRAPDAKTQTSLIERLLAK